MANIKQLKNGKYAIRPRFKDPITGEWTSKYGTFTRKSDAKQWASRVIADAALGTSNKGVTIEWYFNHWLKIFKEPTSDIKTIHRITGDVNYFFDYFSKSKKLNKINPGTYQMFLNDLGTKKAKLTCAHTHLTIRSMFRKAMIEGFLSSNPAEDAVITGRTPKLKRPKVSVLDMQQFKKLMNVVWNTEYCVGQAVLLTHAYTGMRFGEVCGLTWDKLDFENKTVFVSEMYDYVGTHRMKNLKGDSKPRCVTVEEKYFRYMFKYRNWYQRKLSHQKITAFENFCFTTHSGNPISNSGINQYIAKMCEEAGIPRITTHGFRRTLATLLNLAGANLKYIQNVLGHSDATTTLRYYVKTTDDIIQQGNALSKDFFNKNAL